jgi:hypothetical protein
MDLRPDVTSSDIVAVAIERPFAKPHLTDREAALRGRACSGSLVRPHADHVACFTVEIE